MSQLTYTEMGQMLLSYETYEDMLVRDPLNYHEYLVEVIDLFPEQHDFVHMASYQRVLFFMLPHSKFPSLKPRDPNQIVAELLFDSEDTTGWMHPPSLFGDSYINFYGWFGLAFLGVEGLALAWIARGMYLHPIGLLFLGPNLIHFTFIGLRGQPYTLAVYTITMLVYLLLLMKMLKIPLWNTSSHVSLGARKGLFNQTRGRTKKPLGRTPMRRLPLDQ